MIGVVLSLVSLYYLSTLISRRFTWATLGTIAVILVTGTMMGVQSGRMVDNKSTPWMGLEERISAYGMVIWTALAAAMLLRTEVSTRSERRQTPRPTALPLSGVPG